MSHTLQQLGQYTLQELLGRHYGSEVWKAYDSRQHRLVVLKLLVSDKPTQLEVLSLFQREAEALARLHHSSIAPLLDARLFGEQASTTRRGYVVRAYVPGHSLDDFFRSQSLRGKLPIPVEVIHLCTRLGLALDTAHQQGIIHGALKPTNIFLHTPSTDPEKGFEPIITDFGIARVMEAATGDAPRRSLEALRYLSPEQARGLPEQVESDLYALGILLYQLCTGTVPFQGSRPVAVLTQHVNALPPPPNLMNPHLSAAASEVIMQLLAKEPRERGPNATTMTIALADALNVPLPDSLRLSHHASTLLQTKVSTPRSTLKTGVSPAAKGTHSRGASSTSDEKRRAQVAQKRRQLTFTLLVTLVLLTVLTTGFGTFTLLHRSTPQTPVPIVAGHAFFVSSGQLNEHQTPQGINDELQIDLSGIPDPGTGWSYYAWLLPDLVQTEAPPILLGKLPVQQGHVHFLYKGGASHLNLLAVTSRFLITRESAAVIPSVPSLDTSTWRYMAQIPQAASPKDALHFSMLGHFRHLLVESPELSARGLHGGLVLWLVQTTQTVFDLASSARDAWQAKNFVHSRAQLIRLVDALDGKDLVHTDLPATVPVLADPHTDQIPLLGLKPNNADPPGYSYGDDVPPGYVYLISLHLSGALLSPEASPAQRTQAAQINAALNTVDHWLQQAHDDARQLILLSPAQFAQPTSQAILNDLLTQTQFAYTGQISATTGQSEGGVLWVASQIQRLVDFVVLPYAKKNEQA